MHFQILETTDTFVYGRFTLASTDKVFYACEKAMDKNGIQSGEVGEGEDASQDDETRKSTVSWMYKSKKLRSKIDDVVAYYNGKKFQRDITDGAENYQVTVYDDVDDHYDWHQDHYDDVETDFVRTLSLSICLTPDDWYEGAEFFIKDGSETNIRVFKMKYGDFIIFPSDVEHKINALREGSRTSLVVWYGHEVK